MIVLVIIFQFIIVGASTGPAYLVHPDAADRKLQPQQPDACPLDRSE